jgi:hypothetical protein
MLNSYWLFWPLSYQLKAGKWLFDVMTDGALGYRSNMAGAAWWNYVLGEHVRQFDERPGYKELFGKFPETIRFLGMFLPITPGDMGVSLSRPTRYALSLTKQATGFGPIEPYESIRNPYDAIKRSLDLGLGYSGELVDKVLDELAKSGR